MIRVGIIGGTGYTGGELLRLLCMHPMAEVTVVTSRSQAGKPLEAIHPNLKGLMDLRFEDLDPAAIGDKCDVVFTAVPHGAAMSVVPGLVDAGLRVIDLSADYRLPAEVFERVYKKKHLDPRPNVYGLPELHAEEIKNATVVGNPGCYPTGAILAGAPLVRAGVVERIVFDSKSGISGAGQEPSETTHYPNVAENIRAYNITTHRHKAEIEQELGALSPNARFSFTPHVIPSVRGILTTAHVFVNRPMATEEVQSIYEEFYADKPFVRMNKPSLANVRGSNFCDISFEVDEGTDRIVVVSAIDNMVKGAAGQAIQNMNIMYGLDERTGIWMSGLPP
ncbi:N-acetyl-gamma-glutamyl-phosphate reductase [Methanocella conradii HZ254]|uniref:N-acetyl-gamma-glutamyl-phosphate reductase n=1 Tax=Methanocella conradii (strain DSM 24694 / JCM 17849 / CGMCC 1.5162 / HZ254) TaxID=1041930 RepID=H8I4Z9_METCZ|nr:N-acetyl-gamma-glutamyl-phosphate reductase [Methanocella conradii]AFD01093.1 N-acetyl-gamma-glutamyl-phosphate reductase [Methanocella conradii HZ254]MDI6897818.1 N-acetyl-gamma-glutamyl-phosphate reductase [Methanocella conradii]